MKSAVSIGVKCQVNDLSGRCVNTLGQRESGDTSEIHSEGFEVGRGSGEGGLGIVGMGQRRGIC